MKMFEELAQLVDEIDSVNHALMLKIPDSIHVLAMRGFLPDFIERLQGILDKNNEANNEDMT